mmetsp:Transcript_22375/g.48846  ORF Transcript_22375/g.48846 Transcript_22375/m.48846 type:complete len:80 (+) Transcript_22375:789-1028(+)
MRVGLACIFASAVMCRSFQMLVFIPDAFQLRCWRCRSSIDLRLLVKYPQCILDSGLAILCVYNRLLENCPPMLPPESLW